MKTQVALISLLTLPAFASFGADAASATNSASVPVVSGNAVSSGISDRPSGVLGTSFVDTYGTYEFARVPGSTVPIYQAFGLGLNQKVYANNTFGIDAGFDYQYWNNLGHNPKDYYSANAYTVSVTGYLQGRFEPFVTLSGYWDTTSYYGASNVDSTWFAAKFGVEAHLAEGWYVTPAVTVWSRVSADERDSSVCSDWSLETGYWVTKYVGVYASENYRNMNTTKESWTTVGLRIRY
jgi:hypothetical protein